MQASKWNFKTRKYENYELPKDAVLHADLDRVVDCAQCGNKLTFGSAYTSRQIHSQHGFGYGVCHKCYDKELLEGGE